MKYFIFALLTLSFMSGHERAHAAAVAGALEPTQILNNIELVGVNISDAATTVNTYLLQIKATVLDPLGNSLIVLSQLQTANSIISLVNGGGTNTSLIPPDPRKYIDQKGLEAVKISLGAIASQQGGAFSDTLLSSITNNFKTPSFTLKLQSINQSSIPSIVQRNACDDANLTALATNDVNQNGTTYDSDSISQSFRQAAITKRKKEIYDSLCVGNPSTDQQLANRLQQISVQRPDIGGWDSWLALTGGENAYTKSVQTNEAVAEELEARKAAADREITTGRGVISQKKCLVRAPTDGEGGAYPNPEDAPCISDIVLNPSGLLQDSLTKAANAGLERLNNIQGWGSLISTLTSIKQLSDGIRSVTGAVSSAAGSIDGGTSSTGVNTSNSTTVTTAPINDLANDPTKKASIVEPIVKLLDIDTKLMSDLRAVDQTLLADLGVYESRLDDIQDCYEEFDPQNSSAFALFANRNTIIDGLRAKISKDTSGIASATTAIQSLRTTLTTSQSTTEIMDAFNTYQNTSSTRPDYTTLAERKGDYTQSKSQATADLSSNGELSRLGQRCENLRQQANSF
jgi:hypothetical protein